MSEADMINTQLRVKALELATEGAAAEAAVTAIIDIATAYYNFLKGDTNE